MYILHITPSYKPAYIYGGPIISVSRLAESQQEVGAKVEVLTTTANGATELEIIANKKHLVDGVPVRYFFRWTKDHTHFSPGLLWHLFKTAKSYDVIHIHSWWNLVAMFSVGICWLRRVRPVLSPRGMLSAYTFEKDGSRKKNWMHRLLGKWLLSKTILHGTAPAEVEEAKHIHPNWVNFVLPNIVDLPDEDINPFSRPLKGLLRVVFLSRIDPKKGLDIALKALAKLTIPWHLSIAGEADAGYQKDLDTLVDRLGIKQNIHWLGWLNGEGKYSALKEADLFILTSRNENFANVVLESLACGTPVLLSERVGLSHYISANPELGWVCSLDTKEITAQIEHIYQQQTSSGIDRASIHRQVLSDFDNKKIARQYLEAYQACVIEPAESMKNSAI